MVLFYLLILSAFGQIRIYRTQTYDDSNLTFTTGFLFIQDTENIEQEIHVEEFSNVNLWCNATGSSKPIITWLMETEKGQKYDLGITGKRLQIRNITRDCSSQKTYICNATNGVNSIFRKFQIIIKYKPFTDISVVSSNRTLQNMNDFYQSGKDYFSLQQKKGDIVTLVCIVESSPFGNTSWILNDTWIVNHTTGTEKINLNSDRNLNTIFAGIEEPSYKKINAYEFQLKLHFKIDGSDLFSQYKCCSKNEYGEDCWIIYLQEI